MPITPRRRRWLLNAAIAVLALGVVAYLASDRAPPAPVAIAESAPAQVEEKAPPPRPPPVQPLAPEAPRAAPSAATAPDAPQQPPTMAARLPDEELEIPPEEPQTPKWKLEKTTLIAESLDKRVKRLEAEVRDAEASGDRERAAAQRTLLERSQKRAGELEGEIASLREQVKAAGTSP